MRYLVAKHFNQNGSIALKLDENSFDVFYFKSLTYKFINDDIQVLTVGSLEIYSEYEPVCFANNREDFEEGILQIIKTSERKSFYD